MDKVLTRMEAAAYIKMTERNLAAAANQQAQFDSYVQDVAGSGGTADELAKLAELHSAGTLSDEEYAAAKAKAIG